jgi:hypothetical protein
MVSANAFDRRLDNPVGLPPTTSSSSRCAWPNCWTGWAAALALQWIRAEQATGRPPPTAAGASACRRRRACVRCSRR